MYAIHNSVGRVQPSKVMRTALEGSPLRFFNRKKKKKKKTPRGARPPADRFLFVSVPTPLGEWARSQLQRWVPGCGTECPHPLADSGTVTTCPAGPRCDSRLKICRFESALGSAPGRTRPTGAPSSSMAPAWKTRLGQGRSAGRRGTPRRRAAR